MSKGVLTVVSGFSGSGKGTIIDILMKKYQEYALSVSVTTRAPRPGEEEGREYFFRTREEFEEMIRTDALIEYAEYVGNYYGTPRSYVERMLSRGKNVILEIEMQGAMKIRKRFPDAVLFFVTAPSVEELRRRLVGRNTETAEVIAGRLAQAAREANVMLDYDYLLVNETDKAEECADLLHGIIRGERARVRNNAELIRTIRDDLNKDQDPA
ncbi:MAG: guanylate kinase [Blautia sp.]|nr:guanylate kinase [Blautia sp.]